MITTNEGLLEAWANQLETMEQNLESFFGAPSITPSMPAVTTREGMLEAIATGLESVETNMKSNCPAIATGTSIAVTTKNAPKSLKSIVLNGTATGLDSAFVVNGDTTISGVSVRTYTVRCYVELPDFDKGENRLLVVGSYFPQASSYANDIPGILLSTGSGYRAYLGIPIEWLSATTAAGIKAYMADHPLTIWYRSASYDAASNQYYVVSINEADGTFHGISSTSAVAPLTTDDSIDFVKGTITRSGVTSSLALTESTDNLYGSLGIIGKDTLTVKYVKDLS